MIFIVRQYYMDNDICYNKYIYMNKRLLDSLSILFQMCIIIVGLPIRFCYPKRSSVLYFNFLPDVYKLLKHLKMFFLIIIRVHRNTGVVCLGEA